MKRDRIIFVIEELLKWVGDFFYKFAIEVAVVFVAVDFIVVMMEVISRSAGATFAWSEELSRWLLVGITFIGASVVSKEGGHIRVAYFLTKLPKKVSSWINLIGEIGILFFLLYFTFWSWKVALSCLKVKGDIIQLPLFLPKMTLVIGGVFMIVHKLCDVLRGLNVERLKERKR